MTADTARAPGVGRESGVRMDPPRAVTRALFVKETVLALRHPVTVAAVVLQLVLWVYQYLGARTENFPVMTDADHATQIPMMLLLGSAAFLTGNFATIRSARFRTDLYFTVLPLSPRQRTTAVVSSSVALGALSLLMTVAHIAVLQSSSFAAGSPKVSEVAAGPLAVLMLGFAGVLVGQFFTSPVVAPLALLSLGAVMAIAAFPIGLGASRVRWLLPLATDDVTAFPMPGNLLDRPAGMHLIYLTGLSLVLCLAALGRNATRRGIVGGVAALLAVATAGAGLAQLSGPTRELVDARTQATLRPAAQQVCEARGAVTYCGFAQFRPWFADWQRVTDAVLTQLPGDHPALAVRQRVFIAGRNSGGAGVVPDAPVADWRQDDKQAGTPDTVSIGTAWGTGAGELELAVSVAARVVAGDAGSTGPICGGRAIAILWVAGHADARALQALREAAGNGSGDLIVMPAGFDGGPAFNRQDLRVALSLLKHSDRSPREVAWGSLTNPKTTTAAAAAQLGVPYSGGSDLEETWC